MKFVLAMYGTRGDVEPGVAVGLELQRRGHDVQLAVAPDLVGHAESPGLNAVAFGRETRAVLGAYREFWMCIFGGFWRIGQLRRSWRQLWQHVTESTADIRTTLTALVQDADVLFTGLGCERTATNVAERYDIPLAALHYVPVRVNGQLISFLPARLTRSAMAVYQWLDWRLDKKAEDRERRALGLPRATCPFPRRLAQRGSLEIQAYDDICFPGLAVEWARSNGRRPFVGTLTMEVPTGADEDVASWAAAGTPPIFFGFGSMPVDSPAETLNMIGQACAEIGERALVCSGWSDFDDVPQFEHVRVVDGVNFASIFPACRAVVHHGGAGTTAVGMRAGIPTLILSMDLAQTIWGARVKRLKIGTTRRFSATTTKSLVADLRTILAPECVIRARDFAAQMTTPAEGVVATADLLENFARLRRVG